jgi:hypothetical protein
MEALTAALFLRCISTLLINPRAHFFDMRSRSCLLVLVSAMTGAANSLPSNCTAAAFARGQAALNQSIFELRGLIVSANSKRPMLDTLPEEQVVGLAEAFATFAAADFGQGMSDGSVSTSVYYWLHDDAKWSSETATNFALAVPCQEQNDTATEVERAAAGLAVALNGTTLRKPLLGSNPLETESVFSPATGLVTTRTGTTPGRAQFPAGQCGYSCFMPPQAEALSQLKGAGPLSDHSWIGANLVTLIVPPAQGSSHSTVGGQLQANTTEVARLAAAAGELHGSGYAVHLYLRQSPMPAWLPDFFGPAAAAGDAKQGNADFNYDSDAALTAWGVAFSQLLPAIAASTDGNGVWSFMACNEAYASRPASTGSAPGNASLARFRLYLQDEYQGNVSQLNSEWNTQYESFDAIAAYPADRPSVSPSASVEAAPTVAAYMDFSHWILNRTSWFYSRLAAQIRGADASTEHALVHIKNKNYGSWGSWNNGFDREAIARLGGVVGVDTRDMPGDTAWTKVSDPFWSPSDWALDWRAPAVSYAYMRSIGRVSAQEHAAGKIAAPGFDALCARANGSAADAKVCSGGSGSSVMLKAPVFDSETHFVSVSSARTMRASWHHGHSSSLVAASFGLGISSAWFWNREANGSLVDGMGPWGPGWSGSTSCAGGEAMQPAYMAGKAQALRDINSAPSAIALLVDEDQGGPEGSPSAACILRCEVSRFLDGNWSVATLEAFAGLALASTRAQLFVTDRQLAEAGADALASCGAVAVPACGHAADTTVDAVRAWTEAALSATQGPLIVFPAASQGPPVFGFTERGQERSSSELAFLQGANVEVVEATNAVAMARLMDTILRAHKTPRAVICQPVGGVVCKWAVNGTDTLLVALNARPIDMDVSFTLDSGSPMPGSLIDEASGFKIGPASSLAMQAGETRMLRIVP